MSASSRDTRATLVDLARSFSLQTSYTDLQQREIHASSETLLAALGAMHVISTSSDIDGALHRKQRDDWEWHLEPACVAWQGHLDITLRLPRHADAGMMRGLVELEEGGSLPWDASLDELRTSNEHEIGSERFVELRLPVPYVLPLGYHRLRLELQGRQLTSMVISSPRLAYRSAKRRSWGVFLPLHALWSRSSHGIGDYADLRRLVAWTGSQGGAFVGTLPLLPTFLDEPYEPSPYQPVSRLLWNEVYVDVGELASGVLDGEALYSSQVRYREVMRAKRDALASQEAAARQDPAAQAQLDLFLQARPSAGDYAQFRAALETLGPDWHNWPEAQRDGELSAGDYEEDVVHYYRFAQWRAHQQMRGVADEARRHDLRLYLDLPVGVHCDGYDAWRYQDLYAQSMLVGAPPDLLSSQGQVWGFQPLLSQALRATSYAYYIDFIRHHLQVAGMLRIDHAIGLHRIYWIPEGETGRNGVFVRQPAEELYAILCLESHRHSAVMIGENLGLVPPEVDAGMREHRMPGMYVQMFEMTGQARAPQNPVPELSIASFSTHDLPPFAGYWQNRDLCDRRRLGLLTPERVAEEVSHRTKRNDALLAHLRHRGFIEAKPSIDEVFRAGTALLAESDADWLAINLEDTWGEIEDQNLPGTTGAQHPNWLRRAKHPLDDFDTLEGINQTLDTVRLHRPSTAEPSTGGG